MSAGADTGLSKGAQREKNRVTVASLAAAVCLTAAKLAAGLATGSLGLLAEAAHSALDTVASVITFFSVRVAGRPADENHPYGHGRVENLSAVVQGVLLLGTAAWVLSESIGRIFFEPVAVQVSVWAFVVMGVSVAVDLWRSRMLYRVARRHGSRALEADALNFRADMFSSSVVIIGLALSAYGASVGGGGWFLERADAFAALLVGLFILGKAGQLAMRSVNVLLDLAPVELQGRISRGAESVSGVVETRRVRLRESGHRKFADIVVSVPRTVSAAEAHGISERVEETVRYIDGRTESVVHVEPVATEAETMAEAIHGIAQEMGFRTHHERVQRAGGSYEATLHVEVDPALTLGEAHERASGLGDEIRRQEPRIARVNSHIEVAEPDPEERERVDADHPELVEEIRRAVAGSGTEASCHEVRLYRHKGPEDAETGALDAVLHCDFPPRMGVGEVHLRTEHVERTLRAGLPALEQVVIHAEPAAG
ncbi:cation diffusion facilitator family transporter [Rubrobacter aplysinae]|uniref:cation diffusion facilitator family transporter n=1 Tax=Rubrobacter aplysinae TaxID=909625 RepID=UPI00064C2B57|nr:cation diffusion facilitator family transporter [Rubrobacter aplysinae]